MPRLVWLTDIHVDFLRPDERQVLEEMVAAQAPDAIVLGGDVADARTLVAELETLASRWQCPLYFVLGNHDFYFGSIAAVRRQVQQLCRRLPNLVYLTDGPIVQLAEGVGLIGHDGWADARLGDYTRSLVMMHDYKLIEELAGYDKMSRWPCLQRMGDEVAAFVRARLPEALARFRRVYFLTHVPPFRESCWHQGRISDDEWLPHFSCQALGQALLAAIDAWPDRELIVLCGHTHGSGEYRPRANCVVYTGGATYGRPEIQSVIELP